MLHAWSDGQGGQKIDDTGPLTRARMPTADQEFFAAATAFIDRAHQAGTPFAQQKPNILFIMGNDIGWIQPSVYHRCLMLGETPNIDRIGKEGVMFNEREFSILFHP